jgi:hypothetical protein
MAKLILATFAVVFMALAATSLAGDPDMLQDVCVADYKSLKGRKCWTIIVHRFIKYELTYFFFNDQYKTVRRFILTYICMSCSAAAERVPVQEDRERDGE